MGYNGLMEVELPDGTVLTDVPEGTSKTAIQEMYGGKFGLPKPVSNSADYADPSGLKGFLAGKLGVAYNMAVPPFAATAGALKEMATHPRGGGDVLAASAQAGETATWQPDTPSAQESMATAQRAMGALQEHVIEPAARFSSAFSPLSMIPGAQPYVQATQETALIGLPMLMGLRGEKLPVQEIRPDPLKSAPPPRVVTQGPGRQSTVLNPPGVPLEGQPYETTPPPDVENFIQSPPRPPPVTEPTQVPGFMRPKETPAEESRKPDAYEQQSLQDELDGNPVYRREQERANAFQDEIGAMEQIAADPNHPDRQGARSRLSELEVEHEKIQKRISDMEADAWDKRLTEEAAHDAKPSVRAKLGLPPVEEAPSPKSPPVEPVKTGQEVTKEPWQMTRQEFDSGSTLSPTGKDSRLTDPNGNEWLVPGTRSRAKALDSVHKNNVESALRQGKPVPPEVLADYPYLQSPRAPEVTPVAEQPKTGAELIAGGEGKVGKTPRATTDYQDFIKKDDIARISGEVGWINTSLRKGSAKDFSQQLADMPSSVSDNLFSKKRGVSLDTAAQIAHEQLQIGDGTTQGFLDALRKAGDGRTQFRSRVTPDKASLDALGKQQIEEETALTTPAKSKEQVSGLDLNSGDTFTHEGTKYTVEGTLEPGVVQIRNKIRMTVPIDKTIYVDKGSLKDAPPPKPKLALKGQTEAELMYERQAAEAKALADAQARAKAEQEAADWAKMQTAWSKPGEKAPSIDTGGDLFDQSKAENPLFATPTPKPTPPSPAASPEAGGGKGKPASDWTGATDEPYYSGVPMPKFPNRKMSPLDSVTTQHSRKMQQSFDEARRAQREIRRVIPSERRQNAASVYREAGGDMATLKLWEKGAKQDWMRNAARDAQTLTPEEIAIVNRVGLAFDVMESRGNRFDVLNSHRDNYIPHVWADKPGTGWGGRVMKERFRFSKARTFNTFFDGDQSGFKPKTLAIGNLLPAYIHEMNKVIADRQLVRDIAGGVNRDGSPMASPRGSVHVAENEKGKAVLVQPRTARETDTSDYRVMTDQPALANWTWEGRDSGGKPVFVKADLALHPDAYRRLNAILGQSAIKSWYHEPVSGFAQIPRAVVRGLDVAQSAMKREMFGLLSPFHQVQEGTHGIGHLVNPFFGLERVDMRNPKFQDMADHGLMLMPDTASTASYLEGVGTHSSLLSRGIRATGRAGEKLGLPKAGRAVEAISDVIDGYQDYLFHTYIPALKAKTYEAMVRRNTKLYDPELKSGEMTMADVKLTSAEQANAAYGHLNYALLDRNPTMQHLMRLTLLAPDFLEARTRFAGQAAKGFTSKVGVEQLKAIAILAGVQAGAAYTLSQLLGVDYDEKHPFEVAYKGRRYAMRSVPEDIYSALKDTRQFIYSRVNPLTVRGGIELGTGRNYRGEKTTALDTFEELLAGYIPLTARSLPGVRSLTETGRNNPVSPLQQLSGSLGLRISRYSPITETYKLADDWMESQKMQRDRGVYPVSKYQKLRYALEDGDMERAATEYAALRATMDKIKLSDGFAESVNHPFTGSEANEKKFKDSLNGGDRKMFDLAEHTRNNIMQAFHSVAGTRSTSTPGLTFPMDTTSHSLPPPMVR